MLPSQTRRSTRSQWWFICNFITISFASSGIVPCSADNLPVHNQRGWHNLSKELKILPTAVRTVAWNIPFVSPILTLSNLILHNLRNEEVYCSHSATQFAPLLTRSQRVWKVRVERKWKTLQPIGKVLSSIDSAQQTPIGKKGEEEVSTGGLGVTGNAGRRQRKNGVNIEADGVLNFSTLSSTLANCAGQKKTLVKWFLLPEETWAFGCGARKQGAKLRQNGEKFNTPSPISPCFSVVRKVLSAGFCEKKCFIPWLFL